VDVLAEELAWAASEEMTTLTMAKAWKVSCMTSQALWMKRKAMTKGLQFGGKHLLETTIRVSLTILQGYPVHILRSKVDHLAALLVATFHHEAALVQWGLALRL
jgi:hypothetical protein